MFIHLDHSANEEGEGGGQVRIQDDIATSRTPVRQKASTLCQ